MPTITETRELLLDYIGKPVDPEGRYQLNGVFVNEKNVALHIHDLVAEDEGSAELEWALRGLKFAYDFLESLGLLDQGYDFTFPLSGKLA